MLKLIKTYYRFALYTISRQEKAGKKKLTVRIGQAGYSMIVNIPATYLE
jgi:hypothetical protein